VSSPDTTHGGAINVLGRFATRARLEVCGRSRIKFIVAVFQFNDLRCQTILCGKVATLSLQMRRRKMRDHDFNLSDHIPEAGAA
jgi:hypothetical protein